MSDPRRPGTMRDLQLYFAMMRLEIVTCASFHRVTRYSAYSGGYMAYDGDHIDFCMAFDFTRAYAVVVSGAKWNPCGHMLLNTGGTGGWYFHVAEVRGRPKFMGEAGYQRYLIENGKKEVSRTFVKIPDPDACNRKLEELLLKQWTWFLLPNNCASFVEDVLQAGGTKAGLYSNCPTRETFK